MAETITVHVLDTIPFQVNLPGLMKRLHIKENSSGAADLCHLLDQAMPLAHPRALYLERYITGRGEDWVEIEGFHFTSRVLRVNLEPAYRVFPFLATCGAELQAWAAGVDDMLLNYWAEAIKEEALFCALHALTQHLEDHYRPGKTAAMNPGSLQDWPIQEQRVLFELFGEYKNQIGVRLTDSLLMVPTKSVSGIRFPTQVDFESCQLCPREACPGRRAPYDAGLYEKQYSQREG